MSVGRGPRPDILVRFVRTERFEEAALAARAREVLSAGERETLARLRQPAARRDYLATHALARTTLAELTGSQPARLRFRSSRLGQPKLVAPPGASRLRFSISHADGVALCAVATGSAVGADVESLRNIGPDPLGVAESICSRREKCALRALPAAARAERLLSIWALKEAIAKAMGLGFHLALADITVHCEGDGPPMVEFGSEAVAGASFWRFALWRLRPYHMAAVAVLGAHAGDVAVLFEEDGLLIP